jgi:hypothetical protein
MKMVNIKPIVVFAVFLLILTASGSELNQSGNQSMETPMNKSINATEQKPGGGQININITLPATWETRHYIYASLIIILFSQILIIVLLIRCGRKKKFKLKPD